MEANNANSNRDPCNLRLCEGLEFEGSCDMPVINPCHIALPLGFLPFNQALSSTGFGCGVHFFIDDYRFERVWRLPERYLPVLKRFRCVVAPDFSLFVDAPHAVNVWNVYRNRLIASWLQGNGIPVVPSVSWGNRDTFRFCFDGIPRGGIVAIGHTARGRTEAQRALFRQGLAALMERKSPSKLLIYGKPFETGYANVTFIEDHISKLQRHGKRKPTQMPETLL